MSINLVTLFSLVLAIGIVVDNAIVVVEAVHAKFEEFPHITPYHAVKLVLGEIGGAIIAITAVMVSVFIPVSFMMGGTQRRSNPCFEYTPAKKSRSMTFCIV